MKSWRFLERGKFLLLVISLVLLGEINLYFLKLKGMRMHVNLANNDGHKLLIWVVDCG
jgi:hypothetical protein